MVRIMGADAWWSVPARRADGHPDVLQRGRHHPDRRGAARQGRGARHRARLHDERHRPLAARDDHPQAGAEAPPHRRLRRRGGCRHPGRRLPVQRPVRRLKPRLGPFQCLHRKRRRS